MRSLTRSQRNENAGGFQKVIVDDQIDCQTVVLTSQTGGGEILRPHSRVKQFGLVPGHDQRPAAGILETITGQRTGVVSGPVENFRANPLAQPPQ